VVHVHHAMLRHLVEASWESLPVELIDLYACICKNPVDRKERASTSQNQCLGTLQEMPPKSDKRLTPPHLGYVQIEGKIGAQPGKSE
jgi:hypothetical protein